MARRSAIEVAPWLEITARRGEAPEPMLNQALGQLEQVVAMRVALIENCDRETRGQGQGQGQGQGGCGVVGTTDLRVI